MNSRPSFADKIRQMRKARQSEEAAKVTQPTQAAEAAKAADLERLDKIVDNSSEKNRNFFIAYLGLLIYVQAIIFSTTDLQLLTSVDGLKMPIIDLTVPLTGFYVVVPLFVIALHFNFLQNLESHHYKLMRWRDAYPKRKVPRHHVLPFLFDYAQLEENGQFLRWVRIANNLLCYNFAPITLGLLLIRYSDCQDWMITVWHYLAFVFDVWLVWKMRIALKDNENFKIQSTKATLGQFLFKAPFQRFWGSAFGFLIFFEFILTVLIGSSSNDFFEQHVQPWMGYWVYPQSLGQKRWASMDKKIERITRIDELEYDRLINMDFKRLYDEPNYQIHIRRALHKITWDMIGLTLAVPGEWILPRISIKPSEKVWRPDIQDLENAAKLAGFSDWARYFNEKGIGYTPNLRSLRYISLSGQYLPRAQLSGCRLQAADLSSANMQHADLKLAHLQGADLSNTQIQGADFRNAWLQEVNLSSAQMQGADLSGWQMQMQGANLSKAQLQGADLSGWQMQMQGANLSEAQLQGADLSGWQMQMQGANLSEAQLQGAHLSEAQLQGAHLFEAQLQGADLSEAQMQDAKLSKAQLQGANLSKAEMQGADFSKAQMQGANLSNAQMQEANFSDAQMQGVYLSETQMQGANLSDAQMQGAILWGSGGFGNTDISDATGKLKVNDLTRYQQQRLFHSSFGVFRPGSTVRRIQSFTPTKIGEMPPFRTILPLGADPAGKAKSKSGAAGSASALPNSTVFDGTGLESKTIQSLAPTKIGEIPPFGTFLPKDTLVGKVKSQSGMSGFKSTQKVFFSKYFSEEKSKKNATETKKTPVFCISDIPISFGNFRPEKKGSPLSVQCIMDDAEKKYFIYEPLAIARTAVPAICDRNEYALDLMGNSIIKNDNANDIKNKKISRLAAAQSFRHRYQSLQVQEIEENYHDYQRVLKDIDRSLCTLPECSDLRDEIKGLDCKPYLQKQAQLKTNR